MSKTGDTTALDEELTYMEQLLRGRVLMDSIDDFIDAWHESDSGEERTLAQFLGMSEDEYTVWLASRKVLPLIVAARRDPHGLADTVAEHLTSLNVTIARRTRRPFMFCRIG